MMNNKKNMDNNNTTTNIFIGLFSVVMFAVIICLCVLAKNCLKINILIIKITRAIIK